MLPTGEQGVCPLEQRTARLHLWLMQLSSSVQEAPAPTPQWPSFVPQVFRHMRSQQKPFFAQRSPIAQTSPGWQARPGPMTGAQEPPLHFPDGQPPPLLGSASSVQVGGEAGPFAQTATLFRQGLAVHVLPAVEQGAAQEPPLHLPDSQAPELLVSVWSSQRGSAEGESHTALTL
jgi:hypothetical protein